MLMYSSGTQNVKGQLPKKIFIEEYHWILYLCYKYMHQTFN